MNANAPLTTDVQQDRSRKRKAVLAGGVVLGLGAAMTLAAWSSDVFSNGTFDSGTFELQAAADGTNFAAYDGTATEDSSATLSFQLEALEMAPSQTVYAPLTIATSLATTLDGEFTLSGVSAAGDYAGVLTYRIFAEASHNANCNPDGATSLGDAWSGGDAVGVNTVQSGAALTVLEAQAPLGRQHLCIAVTMGEAEGDAADNQAAVESAASAVVGDGVDTTVTWEFNGQSTDAVATPDV